MAELEEEEKAREEREERRRKRLAMLVNISRKLRSRTKSSKQNVDWERILATKDFHVFLFSMIGLVSSIAQSYYKWSQRCYENKEGKCAESGTSIVKQTATIENTSKMETVQAVLYTSQAILTLSTFVTVYLLTQFYRLKVTERRREWSGLEDIDLIESEGRSGDKMREFVNSYSFFQSSLLWQWAIEVLVHLVHPILWIETADSAKTGVQMFQTIYEVTECAVFLRLYLVLRILYTNSNIYIFRYDIVASNRDLQRSGYSVTAASTAKIMFYNNPTTMVLAMMLFSVILFGFWIFVIERNGNPQFEGLWDCYWFVAVTLATLGYGDMLATSTTGRIVVIIIGGASLVILTLFSGIVTNLLAPSREEKYVTGYLALKTANDEYEKAAVNIIVLAHRERKLRRTLRVLPPELKAKRSPQMYNAVKRLKAARLEIRNSIGSAADPVVDIKLQRAIVMGDSLCNMLDVQAKRMLKLEEKILRAAAAIKKAGSMHRSTAAPLPNPTATSQSRRASIAAGF